MLVSRVDQAAYLMMHLCIGLGHDTCVGCMYGVPYAKTVLGRQVDRVRSERGDRNVSQHWVCCAVVGVGVVVTFGQFLTQARGH